MTERQHAHTTQQLQEVIRLLNKLTAIMEIAHAPIVKQTHDIKEWEDKCDREYLNSKLKEHLEEESKKFISGFKLIKP